MEDIRSLRQSEIRQTDGPAGKSTVHFPLVQRHVGDNHHAGGCQSWLNFELLPKIPSRSCDLQVLKYSCRSPHGKPGFPLVARRVIEANGGTLSQV
jgi:hypothetical protein